MIDITAISGIVALVVAIVGAVKTVYNEFFEKNKKRKLEYYECILKPFIVAYKKNTDISATIFVNSRGARDNDNIPKYIFYLLDCKSKKDQTLPSEIDSLDELEDAGTEELRKNDDILRKVLIYDYLSIYPNDRNTKLHIFDIVQKFCEYLIFAMSFAFLFACAFLVTSILISIITWLFTQSVDIDICDIVRTAIISVVSGFLGLIAIYSSDWFGHDMYTFSKRGAKARIDSRVKKYDRWINGYIL